VYGGLFGAISQYDVGAGGTLSPKSPPTVTLAHDDFPSTDSPQALAVSPDGQSVYVANLSSGDISQYDVGASGALSPKSPPTDVAGGFGVAVSPPRVPMRKEQCKRDGWRTFPQYRNEGQCVSFVQRHP
jgi:DNA-binding beta-propeller fold protein YncE